MRGITTIFAFIIMCVLGGFFYQGMSTLEQKNVKTLEGSTMITKEDEFENALQNSEGYALIYGTIETNEPIIDENIEGEYIYLKKVTEKKVTRYYPMAYSTGKTPVIMNSRRTSWETDNVEESKSKNVTFCGQEFSTAKFPLPEATQIKTVDVANDYRYIYYGIPKECSGTLLTYISNQSIASDSSFHAGKDIMQTIDSFRAGPTSSPFLVIWVILTFSITAMTYIFTECL